MNLEADKLAQSTPMETDRLEGLLTGEVLSLDLISAFAGDRALTDEELILVDNAHTRRGAEFYPDLLFAVTHQSFPAAAAENLWRRILQHKYDMSSKLGRNVRITVASLDYLSNLTTQLHSATVIDEANMADIVRLTQIDGLTGLYNHACCYHRIDAELKRNARYGTPVSLLMIDVDNFKNLNDTLGHWQGDQLLVAMAKTIKGESRDQDICCRYGGDEFAVILPSTDFKEAAAVAERLRMRFSDGQFGNERVTVSIGVASCGEDASTPQAVVEKADAALYQAKRSGRDRVAGGA